MKLGYKLRQINTNLLQNTRDLLGVVQQLLWVLLDLSKFKRIKPHKIKNLLVVYAGATGDAYNVIGILNALKEKYQDTNIFYLTMRSNYGFVKNPDLKIVSLITAKKLILRDKIDAIVLLNGSTLHKELFDEDMRFKMLKIPFRVACDEPNLRPDLLLKQLTPTFLTRRTFSFQKKGFAAQLAPFKVLGFDIKKPKFHYTVSSEKNAKLFLKKYKIGKIEKLVFMHPGAGTITRALTEGKIASHQWPSERWAELANKLISKHDARVIFTGAGQESGIIKEIISNIENKEKVIDTSNQGSIEDIASIIKMGDLLITIDTSMAHIGAQTGIFVIDLFGPFLPALASPLTDKKKIIFHPEVCNSCRKYFCPEGDNICMKAITIKEIMESADKILSQ